MPKIDYKKDYKDLYLPKTTPVIIDVPPMAFVMVEGDGPPQGKKYQVALSLLYSLSYTIKMRGKELAGYYDYTVFPLEGLWWSPGAFDFNKRDSWRWISMIRQPEFVTADVVEWAAEIAKTKKPELDYSQARFERFHEGLCVQIMHVGPYADEPATIEVMRKFMRPNNLVEATGSNRKHHELYLSDPNKTEPAKIKTVIRLPVEVATTSKTIK